MENKGDSILANTNNDKIRVYKSFIDVEHILPDETVLDRMAHYAKLFALNIKFASCFDSKKFIMDADPDIILMNPP